MESDASSSVQSSSHQSTDRDNPPLEEIFDVTKKDGEILAEYLDEPQEGDPDRRNIIVENAMADLVALRPVGALFDKLDASVVRSFHYVLYIP